MIKIFFYHPGEEKAKSTPVAICEAIKIKKKKGEGEHRPRIFYG